MAINVVELLIGSIAILFGTFSLVVAMRARESMSHGMLWEYTNYFIASLSFILMSVVWRTTVLGMQWDVTIGEFMLWPDYFFTTLAFVSLLYLSHNLLKMGTFFGFKKKGAKVSQA